MVNRNPVKADVWPTPTFSQALAKRRPARNLVLENASGERRDGWATPQGSRGSAGCWREPALGGLCPPRMSSRVADYAADHRYVLEQVARAAGFADPVAFDPDEFYTPLLRAARRGPFVPID